MFRYRFPRFIGAGDTRVGVMLSATAAVGVGYESCRPSLIAAAASFVTSGPGEAIGKRAPSASLMNVRLFSVASQSMETTSPRQTCSVASKLASG